MSKYSTTESKFRSFSPQYFSQSPSETGSLFDRHRELIHHHVSQLPNSPKSKLRIEQTFEEMLKSIHFFRKPDIIPFPYLNFDRNAEEKTENADIQLRNLLEELEKEKATRKIAERENVNLRERMVYLLELEKQHEMHCKGSSKVPILLEEIEKLNVRVQLLLDENEDLRRRPSRHTTSDLSKELESCREAYEELRKVYTRDVNNLKEKFDKLYSEKVKLELKLREFEKPEKEDDSIQEKIRNMKNEYRDKLRNLDFKFGKEHEEHVPDSRIKVIEDRIAKIQEAIDQSSGSERPKKIVNKGERSARVLTPNRLKERSSSPSNRTWQERPLSYRSPARKVKSPHGAMKNIGSPGRGVKKNSEGRDSRASSSRSPGSEPWKSPSQRTLSRKRLYENHAVCETCVKRHGHEWAKSPR